MLTGKITPDNTAVFARDFKPESILSDGNPSFRGNVNLSEGQEADVVFLNADQGLFSTTVAVFGQTEKIPH